MNGLVFTPPKDRIVSGSVQLIADSSGVFQVVDSGNSAFSITHYYGDATHEKFGGLDVFFNGNDGTCSIDSSYNVSSAGQFATFQTTTGSTNQFCLVQIYKASGAGVSSYYSPEDMSPDTIPSKTNLRWLVDVLNPTPVGYVGMDNAGKFCGSNTFTKWQFQSSVGDAGTSIGYEYDTLNTLSVSGALHTSWKNNTTVLMSLDKDGLLTTTGGLKTKSTGTIYAIFDTSSLASTDKTFTLPNTTGTFGLLERAQTWTAANTFSAKDVHTLGIQLTNGLVESALADASGTTAAAVFLFKDTITRTQAQFVTQIQETGTTNAYMIQTSTGEWSVGYGCAPQSGYILGFVAATNTHPSYSTLPLSNGALCFINHIETTLTPTSVSGLAAFAYYNAATATIPTATMGLYGSIHGAGSSQDISSFSGKKIACIRTWFYAGSSSGYKGVNTDLANNTDSVRGNFDSAWHIFSDAQGYSFVKGSLANPTNKPALVGDYRVPIPGMGSTTQVAICGTNRILNRSSASGHTNEDINNCTNSFFMSVPFPAATATGARTTLRTTNAAHFAIEGYAAALGGPTWATWTNPEDSETNNYYGQYLDKGTNNPFGWYQHDGSAWQRQLSVVATGRSTAQTAAVASVVAYTVPAADHSFEVSANVLVTTATLHNFTVTVAYTDEGNTARTLTLSFSLVAGTIGTAIANAAGAVPYEGIPLHIRCKASTTITIATTGTFTTCTYNVEGKIVAIT